MPALIRTPTGVCVTSTKHVETREDAGGRRECKEEGENGLAFEELMEQICHYEKFKSAPEASARVSPMTSE
jgi:hypothetical protein